MNRTITIAMLATLSLGATAAHACTCGAGTKQVGDVCVPDAVAKGARSSSTSGAQAASAAQAAAAQTQGQTQASTSSAQGGNATGGDSLADAKGGDATGGAGGTAAAQGGSNADSYTNITPRAPVNTAVAGFQVTTASCRFAEGLGVQTTGVGSSVGFTFKDHDCVRAELAQMLYSRGQNTAGDRLMCQIKEVRSALGDACLSTLSVRAELTVAPTPAPDAVTHAELSDAVQRAFTRSVQK